MFQNTPRIKLCGKKINDNDMLEKTFFNISSLKCVLQYREKEFKKYFELISCLLVAERNNELFLRNHEARLVGAAPFPETNAPNHNPKKR